MKRTLMLSLATAALALGVSFGATQAAPAGGGLDTLKLLSTESAGSVEKVWHWGGYRWRGDDWRWRRHRWHDDDWRWRRHRWYGDDWRWRRHHWRW